MRDRVYARIYHNHARIGIVIRLVPLNPLSYRTKTAKMRLYYPSPKTPFVHVAVGGGGVVVVVVGVVQEGVREHGRR